MLNVLKTVYHAIAGVLTASIGMIFTKIGVTMMAISIAHKEKLEQINN